MEIIGHRGCRDRFPENTVRAVRGAAPHVDMVEIDVQRCKSGELVVFHDERLGKLTGAWGRVRRRSYDKLGELTVDGSAETIPTLPDVLDALPDGTGINIELKHDGMYEDVAPLVRDLDREVIISSFESKALEPFQDEPVATASLFFGFFGRNLETAVELDCEYVHPLHKITDADKVQAAHDQGIQVNAWTVPTSEDVQRLHQAGVDGVIVDSWDIVPDWFGSQSDLQESILKSL